MSSHPPPSREEALKSLREKVGKGEAIIGAGAGIGLSAYSSARANASLIHIYNSGHYRMQGLGSLAGLMPYSNANDLLLTLSQQILPLLSPPNPSSSSPSTTTTTKPPDPAIPARPALIAGVCASDPTRSIPAFLSSLKDMGYTGIQNFPTVGLIDASSTFRAGLEETGMGFECEVRMIREARGLGLLTVPYVFDVGEARRMVQAGADLLVVHCGLTLSRSGRAGTGGKTGKSLLECVQLCKEVVEAVGRMAAEKVGAAGEGPIVLCHGGAIATPEDAAEVLRQCKGLHGFLGASSMERMPVEDAIEGTVREFTALRTA